ncbi:hypothetical protein [Cellulosimicrobium funkei]|uniref:hypothetical protein n=1 Tax=Cellulosimicrobium funkei TaxID=264251 RepID=UPI0036A8E748
MSSPLSPDDWYRPPQNPVPGRPYAPENGVWHYTDVTGLRGILKSGALWATGSQSLNDTTEVTFGINDVQNTWAELVTRLRPEAPRDPFEAWLAEVADRTRRREFFFVSASGLADNLPHWNGYAQEGVAVQFDPQVEFRLRCVGDCELYTPDFIPATLWRPVTYGATMPPGWRPTPDPVVAFIDWALDAFAALRAGKVADEALFYNALEYRYLELVCLRKTDAFAYEEEHRLLVVAPPDRSFIRTRETRFGATDYVVLEPASPADDRDRYCSRRGEQLPITHVRVRPSASAGDTERLVAQVLIEAGYDHVGTSISGIPYR